MFSPARGKLGLGRGRGTGVHSPAPVPSSPALTPHLASSGALRGGLALLSPWTSSFSRISPVQKIADKSGGHGSQPVLVCDFPHQLRTSYSEHASQRADSATSGGMDGKSGLSWVLHGHSLFVWSHLNSSVSHRCAVLTIPSQFCSHDGRGDDSKLAENWLVCIVGRQPDDPSGVSFVKECHSAGVIMCNRKSLAVVYWPDIFNDGDASVISIRGGERANGLAAPSVLPDDNRPNVRRSFSSWTGSTGGPSVDLVNSLIGSTIPGANDLACVAIAGQSNGDLWRFDCSRIGITCQQVVRDAVLRGDVGLTAFNSSRARSMVWRPSVNFPKQGVRQFLLLTVAELECWNVELEEGGKVSEAWRFDILGNPDTQKDLSGHKQVWLLDLQVDDSGKFFTVLAASFSKDRVNSSSYMQYSLLTFFDNNPTVGEVLRKAPMQVILPKARVEEEDVLYSMRLRIGGKPMGSAVILAGDGTATITHICQGSLKLYQFDLAWGAGKVLDASVVPAVEEGVEGAWLVLTEKSGVWAVPEKVVLLGGVDPPERSLSRIGSLIEDSAKEDRQRNYHTKPHKDPGAVIEGQDKLARRSTDSTPVHDEEAEAIVGRLFHQFIVSGKVESALEKLQRAGGFEGELEMNIFARTSRVIVDTLAKHWVVGGAGSHAIMAAVSSQLVEKQRRHQQYLNFLSVSKCHEELQLKQRGALHIIMEHGEMLAAMVQLRELHNSRAKSRLQNAKSVSEVELLDHPGLPDNGEVSGALWDMVQLVGEKARRNNVMLMDREKSEVFYTRVSELAEFFACIQQHANSIVGQEKPVKTQIERVCEIAEAMTSAIRAALRYRDNQHPWYPSPNGLTPWYCSSTVRSGIWKVASLILELKGEANVSVPSMEPMLVSWLEVVADVLLEGYVGAIAAKVEREEEYRGLQMEYWSRRNTLLSALQQHVKAFADTSVQQYVHEDGKAEQRRLVLQKMYPPLIGLARRHAGYQTLYDICTDLNDMDQLRNLMRESMGLREGRFSYYVFEELYKTKQFGRLLRFGEEFQEDLELFLQDHIDLRWLHELFMQQYTSACSTLHSLAVSRDHLVNKEAKTSQKLSEVHFKCKDSLKERKRLLYLAKLSALAGGDLGGGEKISRIDANIAVIEVQEEAAKKGAVSEEILLPGQLVEACLKTGDRDLIMRAFDVFAYGGEGFRKGNRSLLEAAWLRAADQDNWTRMRQFSEENGWSDEQHWQALQNTCVCQLAKRLYGEGATCYGAPFQEIMPLFEADRMESTISTSKFDSTGKSVEMILMQHPEFPDAGEAMLTALKMGVSVENDYDMESMIS